MYTVHESDTKLNYNVSSDQSDISSWRCVQDSALVELTADVCVNRSGLVRKVSRTGRKYVTRLMWRDIIHFHC